MKRIIRILLLATAVLGFTFYTANTANASAWHKGTPVAIRGWWRTKMKKIRLSHGKYLWTYATMHVMKNKISGADGTQSDGYEITSPSFYISTNLPHTYAIIGYLSPGHVGYLEAYALNGPKKLQTAELNREGRVTDVIYQWYKFSGKASNKNFYPYS
ncbi:hypothetical protein [Lentilactobacillus hilgardii]|uniref:hypothetical protein n=1 Tax=Lentilactobacillus hilgardii TaxID=1588 RepID=UPI00390C66BF